jgi:hypothetical protein
MTAEFFAAAVGSGREGYGVKGDFACQLTEISPSPRFFRFRFQITGCTGVHMRFLGNRPAEKICFWLCRMANKEIVMRSQITAISGVV